MRITHDLLGALPGFQLVPAELPGAGNRSVRSWWCDWFAHRPGMRRDQGAADHREYQLEDHAVWRPCE